ncbi:MAG TPA: ATP-grasp domain-containing protein [Kineosporiaceae bacterium]|nr:ATP-grasp domain-containing protein [Kineosporiaceae bacterium]
MTSENSEPTCVACKWQPKLIAALMERARVHIVLDQFDQDYAAPDPELLAQAASVHTVSNFNALEELTTVGVQLLLTDPTIERVISFTEFSQLGAGHLASVLGLPHDGTRSAAQRDKRLMKHLVSQAGVRTARFHSLPDPGDRAAVEALAPEVTYPAVLKPAAGFGTMSTRTVSSPADLLAATENFRYEPMLGSRQLMVEEFISGDEFHIDALWDGGEPQFFVVSQYYTPRLVMQEGGGIDGSRVLPRTEHEELYRRLIELNRTVNTALGLDRTVTHLEVFHTPDDELVFSEIASRVGGAWTPVLLGQALGRDIWSVAAEGLLTGSVAGLSADPGHLAGIHLRPSHPGVVTALPSDERFRTTPGVRDWRVLCRPGTEFLLNNPSQWGVFVVVGGSSAEDLDANVAVAMQRLRVEIRPADQPRAALVLSRRMAGGVRIAAASLRERGWSPVLVSERADDANAVHCDHSVVLDWDRDSVADLDKALVTAGIQPEAVVNMVEPLLGWQAQIAGYYGLPGAGLAQVAGKDAVRAACDAAGVFPLRWRSGSLADLAERAELTGSADSDLFPVIVKPARDTGASRNVHRADDAAGLRQVINTGLAELAREDVFIVEEYVDGLEFSVDGFVAEGAFTPVLVVSKPGFDEERHHDAGILFSPPVGLEADTVQQFCADLEMLAKSIGVDGAWWHAEGRVRAGGRPALIEINPRPGGRLHIEAARRRTGVDPIEVLIDGALGVRPRATELAAGAGNGDQIGLVNVEPRELGIVRLQTTAADLLALPGVVDVMLIDGFRVESLDEENFFLTVMVQAPTVAEVRRLAQTVSTQIHYTVDPLPRAQ